MGREMHIAGAPLSNFQPSLKLMSIPLYVELVKRVAMIFLFLGVALLLSFPQECVLRQRIRDRSNLWTCSDSSGPFWGRSALHTLIPAYGSESADYWLGFFFFYSYLGILGT